VKPAAKARPCAASGRPLWCRELSAPNAEFPYEVILAASECLTKSNSPK
jgi:hypothetical protein